MKWTYKLDRFETYRWIDRDLMPGTPVLVISKENLMTGETAYELSTIHAESGFPANMDSADKRFHGWRGTTNDIRVEAHGVYKVKLREVFPEYLKVTLSHNDIKDGED